MLVEYTQFAAYTKLFLVIKIAAQDFSNNILCILLVYLKWDYYKTKNIYVWKSMKFLMNKYDFLIYFKKIHIYQQ